MRQRMVLVAATAAIGLLAAGCGGDGGNAGAPSKEDYIAAADRICSDFNAELGRVVEEAQASGTSPARFVIEEMVPLYRDEFARLRELTPPEGDEQAVSAIFDAGEEGVDQIEEDPAAFVRGGGAQAIPGLAQASDLAADYGFEVCGQGGG